VESLIRAARVVNLLGGGTTLSAVAVNNVDGGKPSRTVSARIRLLESTAPRVVVLPFVPQLRSIAAPTDLIRAGLGRADDRKLGRSLREFPVALRTLHDTTPSSPPQTAPAHTHGRRPAAGMERGRAMLSAHLNDTRRRGRLKVV
jgi:hypothetical protein